MTQGAKDLKNDNVYLPIVKKIKKIKE